MMNRSRRLAWSALLSLGLLAIAGSAFAQGGSQGNYDPLTLICINGANSQGQHFVTIGVKAGASGAPAGFTLQWMKLSDWEANGGAWYASDDPRLCKMSFSGQPSFSGNAGPTRWELGAFGEVDLRIGDTFFDETGVSGALADDGTGHFTQPDCQLECGTEYVFRAFAHASRFNGRSCFSFIGTAAGNESSPPPASCQVAFGGPEVIEPGQSCSTFDDCGGGCTFTQGYWKTHGPGDCNSGHNSNVWCDTNGAAAGIMTLGSVTYTDVQICSILNAAAKGNGLLILAHQLIAAKFNACAGSTCDAADIATADTFIGTKIIPPVGTASVKSSALPPGLVTALDNFNNGLGCALHCAGNPSLSPAGTLQKMKWGTLKSHYK
jgi:hypothetical protein